MTPQNKTGLDRLTDFFSGGMATFYKRAQKAAAPVVAAMALASLTACASPNQAPLVDVQKIPFGSVAVDHRGSGHGDPVQGPFDRNGDYQGRYSQDQIRDRARNGQYPEGTMNYDKPDITRDSQQALASLIRKVVREGYKGWQCDTSKWEYKVCAQIIEDYERYNEQLGRDERRILVRGTTQLQYQTNARYDWRTKTWHTGSGNGGSDNNYVVREGHNGQLKIYQENSRRRFNP